MQCVKELITEFDTHSIFSLDPKGNTFLSSSERIGTEPETFTLLKSYLYGAGNTSLLTFLLIKK